MSVTLQRLAGLLVLLAAGVLSLPVAAAFLDGRGTENWIVPAQFAVMALVGACVCLVVPALAPEGASRGRRALTGVWCGLSAAFVGVIVFWVLLSGIRGA